MAVALWFGWPEGFVADRRSGPGWGGGPAGDGWAAYSGSKAALDHMSQVMQMEQVCAPSGNDGVPPSCGPL